MRTSLRICNEPMAQPSFTTGAWNRSKTARLVIDEIKSMNNMRNEVPAKVGQASSLPLDRQDARPTLTGRRYWRSLDELGDTPEFKQWLEREFPQGASEFTDPVSRRHFVKIMSASFALAGLGVMGAGCRRPEEKLVPFGQQPEGYVYGEPKYYATAMTTRTGAIPL